MAIYSGPYCVLMVFNGDYIWINPLQESHVNHWEMYCTSMGDLQDTIDQWEYGILYGLYIYIVIM